MAYGIVLVNPSDVMMITIFLGLVFVGKKIRFFFFLRNRHTYIRNLVQAQAEVILQVQILPLNLQAH